MNKIFKILAIETSTPACSVALLTEHGMATRYECKPRAHTHLILPMIEAVLQETGETLNNIHCIAFGAGPGSFTGVRIASSVAQGLAKGLNKPVVPVSSLQALAQGILRKQNKEGVLSVIDARMNEVYWGFYKKDETGLMQLQNEECLSPYKEIFDDKHSVLPSYITNLNKTESANGFYIARLEEDYPEAQDVAIIAAKEYALGRFKPAEEALPVYLRNKVA